MCRDGSGIRTDVCVISKERCIEYSTTITWKTVAHKDALSDRVCLCCWRILRRTACDRREWYIITTKGFRNGMDSVSCQC